MQLDRHLPHAVFLHLPALFLKLCEERAHLLLLAAGLVAQLLFHGLIGLEPLSQLVFVLPCHFKLFVKLSDIASLLSDVLFLLARLNLFVLTL